MRTLLSLLWSDRGGSVLSAEMALVTSVTIGALFMGMAEFSATVNREFQNSARVTGLIVAEDAVEQKKAKDEETKRADEQKKKTWRFRRAEDRKTADENN